VLCDADRLLCSMLDAVVTSAGHEVVGIADSTATATALIEAVRPDAVILDLALGYNTDFDVVAAAASVGAAIVVFSATAEAELLGRAPAGTTFVPKPDFVALEHALRAVSRPVDFVERRRRPAATGIAPANADPTDAAAFYQALNDAAPGDALMSVDLPADTDIDGRFLATHAAWQIRQSDRLLGTEGSVRIFLAGAGADGVDVVLRRVQEGVELPPGTELRAVVIAAEESPADAFDRLRHSTDTARLST